MPLASQINRSQVHNAAGTFGKVGVRNQQQLEEMIPSADLPPAQRLRELDKYRQMLMGELELLERTFQDVIVRRRREAELDTKWKKFSEVVKKINVLIQEVQQQPKVAKPAPAIVTNPLSAELMAGYEATETAEQREAVTQSLGNQAKKKK